MVRTQIQLEEEQARALRRLAAERGVSMAALVREGVDEVLERSERDRRWERALASLGMGKGDGANISEDHDEYFVEAIEDWRSS